MAGDAEIEAATATYIKVANTNVGLRAAIGAALDAAAEVRNRGKTSAQVEADLRERGMGAFWKV